MSQHFTADPQYYEYAGESALLGRRLDPGVQWRVMCRACNNVIWIPAAGWSDDKPHHCGCWAVIGYSRCRTFAPKAGTVMPERYNQRMRWIGWLATLGTSLCVRKYSGTLPITPARASWPPDLDLELEYRKQVNPKKLARQIMEAIKNQEQEQCRKSPSKKSARRSSASPTTPGSSKPGKKRSRATKGAKAKS